MYQKGNTNIKRTFGTNKIKTFGKDVRKRKYNNLWKSYPQGKVVDKLSTELSTRRCGKHKSYPQVDKCIPQYIVFGRYLLSKGNKGKARKINACRVLTLPKTQQNIMFSCVFTFVRTKSRRKPPCLYILRIDYEI